MTNLAAILSKPAADVKELPNIPAGTYRCIIVGLPTPGQSSKKKTDYLEFTYKLLEAMDEVDPADIKTFNSVVEGGLIGRTIKEKYYITEASLIILKRMLENAGIESEGRTMEQMIDESPNAEIMVFINHEPTQDGQRTFARVGRTAPVEG